MPQMAPMWWLTLFMSFTMSMMIFSIMNFSIFLPKINSLQNEIFYTKLNWKW